jgi:F5/8 type C domain
MNLGFLLVMPLVAASLVRAGMVPDQVRIDVGDRVIRSFDPKEAFGGGLDGHGEGDSATMLSPKSVRKMLASGLGPVSVRLRTELAVEAWHWNPLGYWSDPGHSQGYWTSDPIAHPDRPILTSFGYKLPRRGNTLDEANDDGYSRLTDGNRLSFWKSNPYLTRAYTGESDASHPQWVVLDFGKPVPINAMNILWGEPFATRFRIEYATQGRVYFGGHPWNVLSPVWRTFPGGFVQRGKGGEQFLKFGRTVCARYVRIWMTESSGTAPKGSSDPRDAMGYAIREIMAGEAGRLDFEDHVIHRPGKTQTLCYVSSTDPWHRACDRDPKTEQPGIDRIARCGITRGLPLMLAIPVLYDTPENGAALAAYARRQGIPVSRLELGEEPDGQRIDPADFGALYAQTARRIRSVDSKAVMGGPSFVTLDGGSVTSEGSCSVRGRGIRTGSFPLSGIPLMTWRRARHGNCHDPTQCSEKPFVGTDHSGFLWSSGNIITPSSPAVRRSILREDSLLRRSRPSSCAGEGLPPTTMATNRMCLRIPVNPGETS